MISGRVRIATPLRVLNYWVPSQMLYGEHMAKYVNFRRTNGVPQLGECHVESRADRRSAVSGPDRLRFYSRAANLSHYAD
jgi:hypothetical protein